MPELRRTLSKENVSQALGEYMASIEGMNNPVAKLSGLRLLQALKRVPVSAGPYPDVTLFEAANRIMSDLVILNGVKALLLDDVFPFDCYTVEYGITDKNGFDIRATKDGVSLIGEAFNVAPSFFQSKKTSMLKKLREPGATADFKIIMFNRDAVPSTYDPEARQGEFVVVVDIESGATRVVPNTTLQPSSRARPAGQF